MAFPPASRRPFRAAWPGDVAMVSCKGARTRLRGRSNSFADVQRCRSAIDFLNARFVREAIRERLAHRVMLRGRDGWPFADHRSEVAARSIVAKPRVAIRARTRSASPRTPGELAAN